MFSSGSVKVLGGVCAFCAVGFGLVGMMLVNTEEARMGGFAMFGMAVVFGVMAAACLIEVGRGVTGRIAAVIGCLVCVGLIIAGVVGFANGSAQLGQVVGMSCILIPVGLGSAYYVIHGRFPKEWTFDEIFRWPSSQGNKPKSKQRKVASRKSKKPLRPIDE